MKKVNKIFIQIVFLFSFLFGNISFGQGNYIYTAGGFLAKTDINNCKSVIIKKKVNFNELALSPNGILYAQEYGNKIYKVDTSNGNSTFFCNIPLSVAMTFSPHGKIYIQGGTVTKSLYEIDTSSGTYINLGQMKYKADGDLTFFNDTLYMSGGSGYLIRVEFTSRKPNSVKEIVIGYMKSVNAVGIVTAKLNNRKTIIVTGDSNSLYEVNRFNCKTKFICKSILDTKLYNIVGAASSEETTTFPSLKILKKNVLCDTIFRLNADDGWETYLWNTGEKAQSILIDKSGKYWVEAIYEGYKVSDTINVSIEKKPYSINAGNDTFICQFQTATLTARGGNITKFYWSNGDSTPQIKVLPMVTTDYIVSTKNKKCPNISDTIRVTVYPKPKAGFTLSKVQGLFPLDVHFTNNSKNANKYIWMFGDSISSSNTIDANFIYKQSGLYHPTLIASNPFCSDTATSSIDVYEPYSIYIPDIFTPNSDGLNDLFEPQITSMKSIEGKIFTRWGEEIYSFSIPTNKWWNGTFHDKKVEDGIYIYNLDVIDKRGKSHYYYGRIYVAQ